MQPRPGLLVSCLVLIYLVTLFCIRPVSVYLFNMFLCFYSCYHSHAFIICCYKYCPNCLTGICLNLPLSLNHLYIATRMIFSEHKSGMLSHHSDLNSSVTPLPSRWNLSPGVCCTSSSSWFCPFLTFKGHSCDTPESWLIPHIFLSL